MWEFGVWKLEFGVWNTKTQDCQQAMATPPPHPQAQGDNSGIDACLLHTTRLPHRSVEVVG